MQLNELLTALFGTLDIGNRVGVTRERATTSVLDAQRRTGVGRTAPKDAPNEADDPVSQRCKFLDPEQ